MTVKIQDERVWHWLTPGGSTRLPRRHIFLDTESYFDVRGSQRHQRFAVAVTCATWGDKGHNRQQQWMTWDDPALLWNYVDGVTRPNQRTVLWTHNLGYDVRIADGLRELPRLGWRLQTHNLSARGAWLTWTKEDRRLDMVDSISVFPAPLSTVGKLLGIGKLPLPPDGVGGVGLFARCWRDVEILKTGVEAYLEWLETEDLGSFRASGAAQAWAAFRRKFLPKGLLVHADAEALAAERRAMWTGRCEAYWHGELGFQVVHEWDFTAAYPEIARQVDVPMRFVGELPNLDDYALYIDNPRTTILAEVDIETSVPVVPAAHAGNVLWPVGRFRTTLWAPEIRLAIAEGATVTPVRVWLYRTGPALKEWAEWTLGELDRAGRDGPTWKALVLKHWSRALIGRLAMTYTNWEYQYDVPFDQFGLIHGWDRDSEQHFRQLQIGQDVWEDKGQTEWRDSMPQITGFVQSECRVRMYKLIKAAPEQAVLYCDTDSILVTDMHVAAMQQVANDHPEWRLRLKRSWQGFALWGPHQFKTGQMLRTSGVPKTAVQVGQDDFRGEVWDTLEGSLSRGMPDRVVIRSRVWHLNKVDVRRDGPALGWTRPVRLPEDQPP